MRSCFGPYARPSPGTKFSLQLYLLCSAVLFAMPDGLFVQGVKTLVGVQLSAVGQLLDGMVSRCIRQVKMTFQALAANISRVLAKCRTQHGEYTLVGYLHCFYHEVLGHFPTYNLTH